MIIKEEKKINIFVKQLSEILIRFLLLLFKRYGGIYILVIKEEKE
jgi:hypothetical protein